MSYLRRIVLLRNVLSRLKEVHRVDRDLMVRVSEDEFELIVNEGATVTDDMIADTHGPPNKPPTEDEYIDLIAQHVQKELVRRYHDGR